MDGDTEMKWIKVTEQRPPRNGLSYQECLLKTSTGYIFYGKPSDMDGVFKFMHGRMILPTEGSGYLSFGDVQEWCEELK